jgi:hypothetical protein
MTSEQQPSAGWYPDPSGKPGQTYWDGQRWHTNVPAATSGAAPYGGAAYGVDAYGRPLSDKSKLTAGLLQIFLGGFGVGRFYLGYTNIGVLQILATWLTCGFGALWPLIDGVMILVGNVPDAQGRTLRD